MLFLKVHTYSAAGASSVGFAASCAAAAFVKNESILLRTAPTSASSLPSNAPRFVTISIIDTQARMSLRLS